MLIPAKSHSCTFYQHDRSQITSGGVKGGGRLPDGPDADRDPTATSGRSIDIADNGAPETSQNSKLKGMWRERLGKRNGQSAPDDRPGNRPSPAGQSIERSLVSIIGSQQIEILFPGSRKKIEKPDYRVSLTSLCYIPSVMAFTDPQTPAFQNLAK